jgi:hypothetical protein
MASAPKLLALSRLALPAGLCAAYAAYSGYENVSYIVDTC